MKVFTMKNAPFKMGAPLERPLVTEVDPVDTFTKNGIELAVVENKKNGRYYIAEQSTGAFVGSGDTISHAKAMVCSDIENADKDVMEDQLKKHSGMMDSAEAKVVDEDEFWDRPWTEPSRS